jgi:hypothetical protein
MELHKFRGNKLADLPGHMWIGARVWVKHKSFDYTGVVIAAPAAKAKRAFVRPEGSSVAAPKWVSTQELEVLGDFG